MTTIRAKFLKVDGTGFEGKVAVSLERLGVTSDSLINTDPLEFPLVSGQVDIVISPSATVGSRYRFQLLDHNGLPSDFNALLDIPDSPTVLELSDLVPTRYFDIQEANIDRIVKKVLELLGTTGVSGVESFQGRTGIVVAQAGDYGIDKITGLQTALDGKASESHTHSQYVTTGSLSDLLAGKSDVGHVHTQYLAVSGTPQAGYVPKIVAGVPTWQPDLEGSGSGASGVSSFNTRTGAVVPTTGDYGVSMITGLQAALDEKAYSYEVSNALTYFTDYVGEQNRKNLFGRPRVFENNGYDEYTFPNGGIPIWDSVAGLWGVKHPYHLGSFTVTTLPDATAYESYTIYVSDESGGKTIAFSDGTNWLRVQDRVIVS